MRSFGGLSLLILFTGCGVRGMDGGDASASDDGGCAGYLCEQPTCSTDEDCQGDTFCTCDRPGDGGACTMGRCANPVAASWFDRQCRAPGVFPKSQFALDEKCHWDLPLGSRILATPVVADLDTDGKNEIIISTYAAGLGAQSHLIVLEAADCTVKWDRIFARRGDEPITVADVDGDSEPEIILTVGLPPARPTILDKDGNVKAQAAASQDGWAGPAVADVDGAPPAEIAVGASVYKWTPGNPVLEPLFKHEAEVTQWGHTLPVFADLDGDQRPELITGLHVYDGATGADKTPKSLRLWAGSSSFIAVADFDLDGHPDLGVVQTNGRDMVVTIVDYTHDQLLFGPYTWPSMAPAPNGNGGPPTVADYDGDGVPDLAVSGATATCVFATRCAVSGWRRPKDCDTDRPGALWCTTTNDESSGVSASTSFDLNGDGDEEIVYRDECWIKLIDGPTGRVLAAKPMTSGTLVEYPVVVDVDGNGHADIVVSSEDFPLDCDGKPDPTTGTPWTGSTAGLYVLSDPMDRWMPTRRIWTQHGYHVTEITDGLSVPAVELASWRQSNTWRRNQTIKEPWRIPDVTAKVVDGSCGEIRAHVCNRGTGDILDKIPGTFYVGDPRMGGTVVCTGTTSGPIKPGACDEVACDADVPAGSDVWFRAADDGKKSPVIAECKPGNDLVQLKLACK